MLTMRFGDFQPFVRTSRRDDDRYAGAQVGFVTYKGDTDTQYQVSYFETGARCDHGSEFISNMSDNDYQHLTVDAPLASDKELLRDKDGKDDKSAKSAE